MVKKEYQKGKAVQRRLLLLFRSMKYKDMCVNENRHENRRGATHLVKKQIKSEHFLTKYKITESKNEEEKGI